MPVSTKPVEDDPDVASERQRVLRGDADNDMVKIENLTKVSLGGPCAAYGGGSGQWGQPHGGHVVKAAGWDRLGLASVASGASE